MLSNFPIHLGDLICARRDVKEGEILFFEGGPFNSIFLVFSGSFKGLTHSRSGTETVNRFYMSGDLLAMEGITTGVHRSRLVALESSQIYVIPFHEFERVALRSPGLLRDFNRIMSDEIDHAHVIMALRVGPAEMRVAGFLADLSSQFAARGLSATRFSLSMSRREIASYLGMTTETVSRTLTKFRENGLLFVRNREMEIFSLARLRQLAS
jgi:CRP/FNR family transcriptional regulator